jgi:hypothetical protein
MEKFEGTLGEQDEEMPLPPEGNAAPIPAFVPLFSAIVSNFAPLLVFFVLACFGIVNQ